MSKSNLLEGQFIDAIFQGVALPLHGTLYISLHTITPGEGGNQQTNEATFTGYARQAVAVPGAWTTTANEAENANDIIFPEATAGVESLTYFAVGTALSGAGSLLYIGALDATVEVVPGANVKISAGNLTVTEE